MSDRAEFLRKKADENKTTTMSISIPLKLRTELEKRAKEADLSMSSLCRQIFEIYFDYEQDLATFEAGKAKLVLIDEDTDK